jgi:hypothetical protein
MRHIPILAASMLVVPIASAQTDVDPLHKHCWGENVGFFNWRDPGSPPGSQGAAMHASFLSGFIWGENVGYINLGDGTPANGASYANANADDFGVNLNPATGLLSGFAWGENIGWVNFSGGALASPARPARYDPNADRLRGFAWGENVGWINLDHPLVFVGVFRCDCDWNADSTLNSQDFFDFLSAFFAGSADFNMDAVTNSQDFFDFLTCFFGGC